MFTLYQNDSSFIIEKTDKLPTYIEIEKVNKTTHNDKIKLCSKEDLEGFQKVTEFHGVVGIVNFKYSYLVIAKKKEQSIHFTLDGNTYDINQLDQYLVPLKPDTIHNDSKIKFLPELNIKKTKEKLPEEVELECTLLHVISHTFTDGYYASHNYPIVNLYGNKDNSDRKCLVANTFLRDNLSNVTNQKIVDKFCLTLIFGSISKIEISDITVLILQRRFTPYFGPRYRKRGLSKKNKGFSANSVEVEMLVSSENNVYSVVLHRGSIPIYWTEKIEDVKKMMRKVKLGKNTEPYEDTASHYDTLLKIHGLDMETEIFTLSLLRFEKENIYGKPSKDYELAEKYKSIITHVASNSKLNMHFENINVLFPFDRELETNKLKKLLLDSETMTSIFANKQFYTICTSPKEGTKREKKIEKQNVLLRVNCIDSTDRTNLAVGYFLYNSILELCKTQKLFTNIQKECRFWKEFNEKFCSEICASGDILAMQYVGSLAFFKESFCFDDCLCDFKKCSNSRVVKKFIKKTEEMERIYKKRNISDRFIDNFKQHGYNLYFGYFNYQKRECKDITKLCPYEEYKDSNI